MSQQSKTTLQSAINTQIADNTSGDISAADIRDNLINITDSLLFNTGSGQAITGSLIVTEGITGSLLGTASYATQALSASYAISASYEINYETSSSYANTASYAETATSASYAATASYVLNAVSSSFTTLAQTANTASYIVTAQTASFVATSSWAVSASQAISASWAPSIASNPFPFTGSAIISGSLGVTGSVAVAEGGGIIITSSSPIAKIAITDGSIRNEMTKTSTVITNPSSPYNFSLGSYIYDPINNPFFPLSNAIYSGGTTDLLISSQQKLNLEATSVTVTGSLRVTGSLDNGVDVLASGEASHAEGQYTIASGLASHAEGQYTIASGESSHAEGVSTLASYFGSHAEGGETTSSGTFSHSEGQSTVALGIGSHAEGFYTVALGNYQHVQGQFNQSSSAQSAFIMGNGADANNRSNLVFASGSQFQVTGSLIVTGSTSLNGLMTLQPANPLPSATNGSIAYSSSGDFYFASGSAWNKLTL